MMTVVGAIRTMVCGEGIMGVMRTMVCGDDGGGCDNDGGVW